MLVMRPSHLVRMHKEPVEIGCQVFPGQHTEAFKGPGKVSAVFR